MQGTAVMRNAADIAAEPNWVRKCNLVNIGYGLRCGVVKFNSDLAKLMLGHNTRNRNMKRRHVASIRSDIENDNFYLTGETIIFDKNWVLCNGQNRLFACAACESGKDSMVAVVICGVDPETQDVMDGVIPRRYSDSLAIAGKKNHVVLQTMATWMWRYETGTMHRAYMKPTVAGLKDIMAKYPDMEDYAIHAHDFKKSGLGFYSLLAGLYYIFCTKNKPLAESFIDGVINGAGLSEQDPRLIIRNRLFAFRAMGSNKIAMRHSHIAALFIKAWNAYTQGQKIKQVRFADNEEFPDIL